MVNERQSCAALSSIIKAINPLPDSAPRSLLSLFLSLALFLQDISDYCTIKDNFTDWGQDEEMKVE